ncbi:MAG: alpha/beta hydrolase [Oscillospiraceae bacterium]
MQRVEKRTTQICGIPAIIWGTPTEKVYLYIHGQGGCKQEAEMLSNIVCRYGWQVLSIDLPEHGDRENEINTFAPWHIIPELSMVMEYAKSQWKHISLLANSIGAWFSMLSYGNERFENCFFVSPVLDMEKLISKMMNWANVSEAQLKLERTIPTDFGQTLSWEYWEYVLKHPIEKWETPTKILYGENDSLTDFDCVQQFAQKYDCSLIVLENGEHWFHTEQQLDAMRSWIEEEMNNRILVSKEK